MFIKILQGAGMKQCFIAKNHKGKNAACVSYRSMNKRILSLMVALLFIIVFECYLYGKQLHFVKGELAYIKEQKSLLNRIQCSIDENIYEVEALDIAIRPFDSKPPQMEEIIVVKKRLRSISEQDIEILCRIVEAEAGGEDFLGKKMVADVVINRVTDKRFPNTVQGVVYQNINGVYQFSPLADGRFEQVTISRQTRDAVRKALQGEDDTGGSLYFVAPKIANQSNYAWFQKALCLKVEHGGHFFYR